MLQNEEEDFEDVVGLSPSRARVSCTSESVVSSRQEGSKLTERRE